MRPRSKECARCESKADRLLQELRHAAPNSSRMAEVITAFPQLSEAASGVSDRISLQIDKETASLESATQRAQQNLFWQTLLLVPMTLAVVGVFTYLFGRPIRAIDRAISELGRGTFSRPIAIRGPADLERLAAQLEWLRGRLLDLAQEKNRFLRHMSHELKTPLANIREGTELLMDGAVGELQSSQREVTAILRENGMKLQRLIENLLSFSAWQAKSVGLEISEFKLRPLIKSVLENQQLTLVAQRVRLDVQVEDLTPLADRSKVRLILDNLLSNAVKFTPRGGTISLHARAEREQLILDVMDSGPGIPAGGAQSNIRGLLSGQNAARRACQGHGDRPFRGDRVRQRPRRQHRDLRSQERRRAFSRAAAPARSRPRRGARKSSCCVTAIASQHAPLLASAVEPAAGPWAAPRQPPPLRRSALKPDASSGGALVGDDEQFAPGRPGPPGRDVPAGEGCGRAAADHQQSAALRAGAWRPRATAGPIPSQRSDSWRNCWRGLKLCSLWSACWPQCSSKRSSSG